MVKVTKSTKETIYIDIEDEITAVIDKLTKSDSKLLALVLPKRATTMQSIVNLKLLKKAAVSAKKNIVLITSDDSVLPLAGMAGLHVAKTLQSKPVIPKVPDIADDSIVIDSDIEGSDPVIDPNIDPKTPIGKLAGDDDTIEISDDSEEKEEKKPKKTKKNRKLAVPNFDKFRLKLFIGLGAILLLVVFGYLFSVVLPKAKIEVKTDTSTVNSSVLVDSKSDIKEADIENNLVPMYAKEVTKSSTEKIQTTGKRDDGSKATGKMTLTNCVKNQSFDVPAGTVFSSSGLNFVSTKAVSLDEATYQGNNCKSEADDGNVKTVDVIADSGGSRYNVSARSYSVPSNFQTSSGSIIASGSAMSGGTTQLVSIVAQSDIDSAKQQAIDKLSEATLTELKSLFSAEQGIALTESLEPVKPTMNSTPEVGKEATVVEVSVNVTFTMFGVKRDYMINAIEKEVKNNIDQSKQSIQNTGIDEADIRISDKPSPTNFKLTIQTSATVGPKIELEKLKQDIAGKKRTKTQETLENIPGVTEVNIKYSPFWVFSTPRQTKNITINFKPINDKK